MDTTLFEQYGFNLDVSEMAIFEKFLHLFIEYNAHTNLSAIRDEDGIIEKHFVDSIMAAPIFEEIFGKKISGKKLLDIGSGGGFPGIPLKIVLPELDVTLLDSIGKKVRAMNYFIEKLNLGNISAIQDRAEILAKNPDFAGKYDIIVSRATAYMTDILTWSMPFLADDGYIVLYKMPSDEEQRDRDRIMRKLELQMVSEVRYALAGKERMILVFAKKSPKKS